MCWRSGAYRIDPADLGTRNTIKPEGLGPDMRYQETWEWMKLSESNWPRKKKHIWTSSEEEIEKRPVDSRLQYSGYWELGWQ